MAEQPGGRRTERNGLWAVVATVLGGLVVHGVVTIVLFAEWKGETTAILEQTRVDIAEVREDVGALALRVRSLELTGGPWRWSRRPPPDGDKSEPTP